MEQSFKEFELQGWENVAPTYHKSFGEITPKVASVLVDRAMIQPEDKLLDVACGPGYVGAYALEKGAEVTGVDFSNVMIQEAKIVHPGINFHVMDAEKLQFSDASFDIVLINFGIPHFANPEQAIEEAFRVLKSHGKFLFTIWDKPTSFDMILETVKEEGDLTISLPEGPDFFQFRNQNTSRNILLRTGFHSVEIEQIDFVWRLNSAEEFFQAFYESGVRIGGILRAQKQNTIRKIIDKLEQKLKIFEKDEKLELPVPILLCKASKI